MLEVTLVIQRMWTMSVSSVISSRIDHVFFRIRRVDCKDVRQKSLEKTLHEPNQSLIELVVGNHSLSGVCRPLLLLVTPWISYSSFGPLVRGIILQPRYLITFSGSSNAS